MDSSRLAERTAFVLLVTIGATVGGGVLGFLSLILIPGIEGDIVGSINRILGGPILGCLAGLVIGLYLAWRLNDESRRKALRITFRLELTAVVAAFTILAVRGWIRTPPALHRAAIRRDVARIEQLVNKGADVNVTDYLGRTALHAVAKDGRREAAELLIKLGADVSATTKGSRTSLEYAAEADNTEVARVLLEHGADPNAGNPLYEAAARGNATLAESLLEFGADVNQRSISATPLWIAAFHGRTDVAEILLDHGADVNAKDYSDRTPLFEAIRWGHPDTVRLLLRRGAEVNLFSAEGGYEVTPLHECVVKSWSSEPERFVEILGLLLEAGADVNARDGRGQTALQLATENTKNREDKSARQLRCDAEMVRLLESRSERQAD